jgi:hypothetical protein
VATRLARRASDLRAADDASPSGSEAALLAATAGGGDHDR